MEKKTMYCAIVVPYRVRVVIPDTEMWEQEQVRPDFVLQNMVGATIDFIIKVDRENGIAVASRRLAARSQRYFFAHRPALNRVGTRVKCRVLSVGPQRCLVECYGHDINLTQRELRYTAIAGKYGGGVFCNLPDGTVCMCNYSYQNEDSDFMVGDTVIVLIQRFETEKRQMYGKIMSKW